MNVKTPLVLTRAHNHAGRQHHAGERIEVDLDLAQWLVSIGSARLEQPAAQSEISSARAAPPVSRKEPKP